MGLKLGLNGKTYRDSSGTPATPTWNEIANIQDLTLNVEANESDVSVRANAGWDAFVATTFKGSIDFNMVWDGEDADFVAVRTAFFARTPIHLAIMDDAITTVGAQGLKAMFMVSKFSRDEKLKEAMFVNVSIKPTYHATIAPEWKVVTE